MNAEDLLNQDFITATTDENYEQKREKVLSIVATGKSKLYFGADLKIEQIQQLSSQEILNLFHKYENLVGSQMVKSLGNSIIGMYSKLISKIIDIDSEDYLFQDLKHDPVITNSLEAISRLLYFKFGSFLLPISTGLITFQHINFDSFKNGTEDTGDDCATECATGYTTNSADKDGNEN